VCVNAIRVGADAPWTIIIAQLPTGCQYLGVKPGSGEFEDQVVPSLEAAGVVSPWVVVDSGGVQRPATVGEVHSDPAQRGALDLTTFVPYPGGWVAKCGACLCAWVCVWWRINHRVFHCESLLTQALHACSRKSSKHGNKNDMQLSEDRSWMDAAHG
jgi:hypothetical protein